MCLMRMFLENYLRTPLDSLSYHPSYLIVCILKSSQSYIFLEYPLMLGDATRVGNKEECMLGVLENNGKGLEKEPLNLQEETIMSFSLNPSPLYYEFSFKELNLNLLWFWKVKKKWGEVCRKFCDLENFVTTFPRLKCKVV
ncbi:hypothetical protein M9H77_18231 [Catharanthus roseus]|uniref:Uncharacterized protein n=1 Tax=Catharanthus roseus TaxID=4058 RepID=A0ACC0B770_CATRO|nr:hypothetical protein M9H77_18231 [Catharanthus roseus]